jgi:putative FmdB family regulatory protein
MPIYDYLCEACGPFSDFAPMANFEAGSTCPECSRAAPRALLSVPHFSAMSVARRTACATNEKNAHAPETSKRTGRHPPGCGCCGTSRSKIENKATKSFPGTRPWMISH